MGKRILITGAGGFVGANLARHLLNHGHEVHALVRRAAQSWRLREILDNIRLHEADLRNGATVRAAVKAIRPEWVFHLAVYGAYSSQTGAEQIAVTNVAGCIMLLDACVEAGCEAFVNSGSSSEYGLKDHAASEDEALAPNSAYAVTKAAATHYCQFVARSRNANVVTVRLYSVYGPYEEPGRFIPALIVHGLRGRLPPLVQPRTARDFIHVDDAVDAMLAVASAPRIPRGAVYNVCSGVQTTVAEMVELSRKVMQVAAAPEWGTMGQRAWDTDVWIGSPTRLWNELGWRAAIGLEAGFRQTASWFRSHPEWLKFYEERK